MKKYIWSKGRILLMTGAVLALAAMVGCTENNGTDADTQAASEEMEAAEMTEAADTYVYRESQLEHDKEESVYVLADAYGTPTEITVSTTLKNPGEGEEITDYTTLSDIKNKEGDEEYELSQDGTLIWENHGSDIQYEGTSTQELPVSVQVAYYLDGEEVTAEELAGATGSVRIRFDYTNRTGEDGEIVPFTAITGLLLSEETASNITVTNGSLKSVDGDYLALGYAVPGVKDALAVDELELFEDEEENDTEEDVDAEDGELFPEYIEVSFDAEDFELEFTATILMNGILEELDIDELTDTVDELADGFDELHDGTAQLANALKTLKESGASLVEGAAQLQSGLESLNQLLSQLPEETLAQDPTLAQLAEAVASLSEGSGQLTEGIRSYTDGVGQVYDGSAALNSATYELTESADDLQTLSERIQTLQTQDASYQNYGGIEEGKTGSVYFIIETAEIQAEE